MFNGTGAYALTKSTSSNILIVVLELRQATYAWMHQAKQFPIPQMTIISYIHICFYRIKISTNLHWIVHQGQPVLERFQLILERTLEEQNLQICSNFAGNP
jgi:hypothetical protein